MDKKLVLPGDFLTTEEEFMAGNNTFEENGHIYSNAAGKVEFDAKRHEVSVKPFKEKIKLRANTVVYGKVSMVKENFVLLKISRAYENGRERIVSSTFANLPIANVSNNYVERLRDEYRIGDVVKAKVSQVNPWGTDVRTDEPDLGVVKAFSIHTREPLRLIGGQLKAMSSGLTEKRKISNDYSLR